VQLELACAVGVAGYWQNTAVFVHVPVGRAQFM
jgi:hypothetical protein